MRAQPVTSQCMILNSDTVTPGLNFFSCQDQPFRSPASEFSFDKTGTGRRNSEIPAETRPEADETRSKSAANLTSKDTLIFDKDTEVSRNQQVDLSGQEQMCFGNDVIEIDSSVAASVANRSEQPMEINAAESSSGSLHIEVKVRATKELDKLVMIIPKNGGTAREKERVSS